jgi:hypothetical protein
MRPIPDADLEGDLERVADELDRTPTRVEYDEHGEYSSRTHVNRHGSWNEAVENVGLEPNSNGTRTPERLLREAGLL